VNGTDERRSRHAGVDWSWETHAVCVVDDGPVVERFTVAHSAAGLTELIGRLRRLEVPAVAIERGDGPVVQALLAAELQVFVITSRQVKALRLRYGTAGNKDDRFDAYVLADVLRTDHRRLVPLTPDGPATTGLRMLVRARKDLVAARIAAHNQLRSHLLSAFPGAVGLFAALDSPISLTFLTRFPSAPARPVALGQAADRLAGLGRLLRPENPRRAHDPPAPGAGRAGRRRRRSRRSRHRATRGAAAHAARQDRRPRRPDR